jgi:hypothetical protein
MIPLPLIAYEMLPAFLRGLYFPVRAVPAAKARGAAG